MDNAERVVSGLCANLIAVQEATQKFKQLTQELRADIQTLLHKVHPVLKKRHVARDERKKAKAKKAEAEEAEKKTEKEPPTPAPTTTETDTGASSSTDRPKKAPKAPLPPGSVGNPRGLH